MKIPEEQSSTYYSVQVAPVTWRTNLHSIWDRRWLWLTVTLAAVAAAYYWVSRQEPVYRASALVLVESETMKVLNIQDVLSTDTRDLQYVNTQVKLLQSQALIRSAAEAMKLAEDRSFLDSLPPDADLVRELEKRLSIAAERNSRLIRISATHRSPPMAARLANGVAEEYIRQNRNRKMSASMEAVTWLQQQAEEIKPKLAKSEAAMSEFRQANHAVSVEERQNIVVDKLKEINVALTRANAGRLVAENEWNLVETAMKGGRKPIEITLVADTEQVKGLLQKLADRQVALATLRQRYKEEYPSVMAAQAELKETQEKLVAACDAAIRAIREKHQLAKVKEDDLKAALHEQEEEALKLDRTLTAYNALKRNAEADRALYDSILTRIKETSVASKLETTNVRLVDPAMPPKLPSGLRKLFVLGIGAVFGLVTGALLCLFVERLSDKIKNYHDIESLGMRLVGLVPRVRPAPDRKDCCVVSKDPHSMVAEHFRDLRTNIAFDPRSKDAKVILVTSTIPGEGKTFIATNLGAVFANASERTLIVDADLRNPNQQHPFGLSGKDGLATFLEMKATLDAVVQPTSIANLDLVTFGHLPRNPQELIGSERMKEFMDNARQRYDWIVIDTPPISVVSDALTLLPHADAVLFVMRFNNVTRDFLLRSLGKLKEFNAPVLGVALNAVDFKKYHYYYPYHGRYSKYYQPPAAAKPS
jgi:capsular exopolysaccharide synthesis family protein